MTQPTKTRRSPGRILASASVVLLAGFGFATVFDGREEAAEATAVQSSVQDAAPVTPATRRASELSDAFVTIAEAVTPAVVRIEAEQPASFRPDGRGPPITPRDLFRDRDGGRRPPPSTMAGGSGIIVSSDGYILTNNHVIANAVAVQVVLEDRRRFDARVVGRDPTTDLAVIQIDDGRLPTVDFGDSDAARVGEWVLAVGNPGFNGGGGAAGAGMLEFTVTSGIISAKGRPLDVIQRELLQENDPAAQYAIDDFLQTDAVINPGNSGGPLVNLDGEVIGVNTAIASGSGFYQGYGFAIPANLVRSIMSDLIEHGHVRRALMGVVIKNVTPEDAEYYGLPEIAGALVEDFSEDSPARRAGLERGDVIVAVSGMSADGVGGVQRLVARHEPGERIRIAVIRDGAPREFDVRLEAAPVADGGEDPSASSDGPPDGRDELGIRIGELTSGRAQDLGFDRAGGVVIVDVTPTSPAYSQGVRAGARIVSINERQVGSAGEAEERLDGFDSGEIVSLLLQLAGGQTQIVNIRVP